jgi:nicotinamide mononucleotide adenylyltransferase
MKKLRQVLKELPSRKVVFAFGRFQPPTTGHELLVNIVKKVASAQKADHVIFASRTHDKKSNPLPVDRKVYYLKRMFPKTNFVAANDEVRTFIEAAKMLSGKYKNLVMIAGSDRVPEYKKILEKYNGDVFHFDTVEVVSAGERDPDADSASGMSGTKMRAAAVDGDYKKFKTGLPKVLTDLDGRRLMNEIRSGMGMEVVKEQVKFKTNDIREKYYSGKIFNIGEKVTDGQNIFEIIDRGSNYITVVNESGAISKKWLDSVHPIVVEDVKPGYAPKQISYKGYTTKNFDRSEDAAKAFQDTIDREGDPVAILNAIKATDTYMGLNDKHLTGEKFTDQEKETWIAAHEKARESLNRVGEFAHHQDYWHTHQHELEGILIPYDETGKEEMREQKERLEEMKFSPSDKIKVARIIAGSLGVSDVDEKSGPEGMVNQGLRFIKNKHMTPEAWSVIKNMLQMATDAGINFDHNIVKNKVEEAVAVVDKTEEKPDHGKVGAGLGGSNDSHRRMKVRYALGEDSEREELEDEGMSDEEIDDMIGNLNDDDYLDAYDDEELSIIDDETGEHIDDLKEEALMEVLSRAERIKSKIRFARSEAKRERKTRIALKTRSTSKTINTRARRMAVKMMKQRIAKKPLNSLSVAEKERVERIVEKRKAAIGRIAMKMAPKVRKIENDRLVHRTYTKG